MPHSQCPNIKTDILTLRSKLVELRLLKTKLLSNDNEFYEITSENLQKEINLLIITIDKKIDAVANQIIKPRIFDSGLYSSAGEFSNGRMVVNSGNERYHINISGERPYSEKFRHVGIYIEGRATAENDKREKFHIDFNGKAVYTDRYEEVTPFSKGEVWEAWVRVRAGECYYIDLNGNRIRRS
jgi:hypothetical protein